jgi:cysteine synthase
MKAHNILETIGHTPHIRINRLFGPQAQVWIKSERSNPGGSIKDRIALSMVEAAENSGVLKPGGTIIEPTSGNTGVIQVDAEDAREYGRRAAREEGMLVGISSGATLAAIAQKLADLPANAKVLGFNYDTGERYLSVEGYLPA